MDTSHFSGLLDISGSGGVGAGGAVSSGEIKAAFTTQKWQPPQPVEGKGPLPGARLAMFDKMSKGKDEGIGEVELEDEPETDTSKDKESNVCSGNNDNNGAETEDDTSTSENKESNMYFSTNKESVFLQTVSNQCSFCQNISLFHCTKKGHPIDLPIQIIVDQ